MKKILLGCVASALVMGSVANANAGWLIPSFDPAMFKRGITTVYKPAHLLPGCVLLGAACTAPDIIASIWIDEAMVATTALDLAATKKHDERTINAKKAIKQLEDALGGGEGESSTDGGTTSSDSSDAAVYSAEMILAQIEVKDVSGEQMFENTRQAIKDYLFETPAPDIKGECTQSDKDCAVGRQNEWLLASVALASATADKVLDQTAKANVKDGKTKAEKSEDEKGDTETTGGGKTTLTAHFKKLASNFNAQTSPTGLYNRMADIVLDTHRQINDANALMGRDLEAQGLRIISETGPVLFQGTETEEK